MWKLESCPESQGTTSWKSGERPRTDPSLTLHRESATPSSWTARLQNCDTRHFFKLLNLTCFVIATLKTSTLYNQYYRHCSYLRFAYANKIVGLVQNHTFLTHSHAFFFQQLFKNVLQVMLDLCLKSSNGSLSPHTLISALHELFLDCLYDILLYQSPLKSWHSPQISWAYQFRSFAFAVSSTWNTFPLTLQRASYFKHLVSVQISLLQLRLPDHKDCLICSVLFTDLYKFINI